jgi:hypothetical protein
MLSGGEHYGEAVVLAGVGCRVMGARGLVWWAGLVVRAGDVRA